MSISALALIFNGMLTSLALVLGFIELRILRHEEANSVVYMRWRRVEVVLIVIMAVLGIPAFALTWVDSKSTAAQIATLESEATVASDAMAPREMTDEQVKTLTERLANIEKKVGVQLAKYGDDQEAEHLFTDIVLAFFRAGWKIDTFKWDGSHVSGVAIYVSQPANLSDNKEIADLMTPAAQLTYAFTDIRIGATHLKISRDVPSGTIRIVVGQKEVVRPSCPLKKSP